MTDRVSLTSLRQLRWPWNVSQPLWGPINLMSKSPWLWSCGPTLPPLPPPRPASRPNPRPGLYDTSSVVDKAYRIMKFFDTLLVHHTMPRDVFVTSVARMIHLWWTLQKNSENCFDFFPQIITYLARCYQIAALYRSCGGWDVWLLLLNEDLHEKQQTVTENIWKIAVSPHYTSSTNKVWRKLYDGMRCIVHNPL